MEEFSATSLFEIFNAKQSGRRLADISDKDNSLKIFKKNRLGSLDDTELVYITAEDEQKMLIDGQLVLLDWTVKPNKRNPDKLFTSGCIANERMVYEIVEIKGARDDDDIINTLVESRLKLRNHFSDFFVCKEAETQKKNIECFLVNKSIYDNDGDIVVIKDDTYFLNRYCLSSNSVIQIQIESNKRKRCFYAKTVLDETVRSRLYLRDSDYIIRLELKKYLSWSVCKNMGLNKKEWQKLKEYIKLDASSSEFLVKLSSVLNLNKNDVTNKIIDFLKKRELELDDYDFNVSVYDAIVENNPMIKDKWINFFSEKYNNEINELKGRLNKEEAECNSRIRKKMDSLNQIEAKVLNSQKYLDEINQKIEQQSGILSDLKQKVDCCRVENSRLEFEFNQRLIEKIDWAKTNLSECMADMTFSSIFSGIALHIDQSNNSHVDNSLLLKEYELIDNHYDDLTTIEDVVDVMIDNLVEIGINKEYAEPFSVWLYAGLCTRMPILLAGPYAQQIVDAISVSLFAREASCFYCDGEPTKDAMDQIKSARGEVIAIHHAFQGRWVDYLPEILTIPDRHFFVIHPYPEDLQIEPKSLFSYVMPLFTEFFVVPLCKTIKYEDLEAGLISEQSLLATRSEGQQDEKIRRVLKKFNLAGGFVIDSMSMVCNEFYKLMREMGKDSDLNDNELLMCYFPYAFVTGQINKVIENLDVLNVSSECKKIINTTFGDDE